MGIRLVEDKGSAYEVYQ